MNAQSNLPAQRRELAPIEVLKNTVARKADDFKMVLPSHISVDKFQRTIATAALSNPKLLECDRQSLLVAAMKLAQDGLLPDGREAALVPFKTRVKDGNQWFDKWMVQPMPMAWGLRKKVLQSGEVLSLQVGVVYAAEVQGGNFIYEIGIDPPIRHRPKLDMTDEEMADGNLVAAYSIARIANGDNDPVWSVEVMRRAEVLKVRQMSQTGALGKTDRDGKPIPPKGPWVEWEPEMWKKSVLRRHTKVLPMSGDILDALERDAAEEARAEGAARLLETQPDAPRLVPPTREEQAAAEGADPTTGELPADDDEETARAADAEAESYREGRDDRDMGEGSNDTLADHPFRATADALIARAGSVELLADVGKIEADLAPHREAAPEELVGEVDAAIAAAKARLTGKAK